MEKKSSFVVEKKQLALLDQVIPVMSLALDPAVQLNRLLYYSSDFCYYHVLCSTSGGCTLLPK